MPTNKSILAKTVKAGPFLKWAGGKTQLLNELLARAPKEFNSYYEPFLGSGALFFALTPHKAYLGDINDELINVFEVVRDKPDELVSSLAKHINTSEAFYLTRALNPNDLSTVERASRFIYLNRTCFNGLYRVNKQGKFNVPFANYKNPNFVQELKIKSASKALKHADIRHESYVNLLKDAQPGDFIYIDPPYHPAGGYSDFKRYNKEGFSEEDQKKLALLYEELHKKGCKVMLSNSDTPFTRKLYSKWNIATLQAKRMINSDASKRGVVTEILVTNYAS